MKKSFFYSISILVLLMVSISQSTFSQIQNPNWVFFSSDGLSSGTTSIHFAPNPSIVYNSNNTFFKNTPFQFKDENEIPILNYRGFNCFFDNDGFPVLYVINANQKTYIFDKHGKKYRKKHENPKGILHFFKNVTGGSNLNYYDNKDYIEGFNEEMIMAGGASQLENTSREISILKVGCNLLHVIAGSMIIEVDLSLKSWDFFIPYIQNSSSSYTCNFLANKGLNSIMSGNGSITFRESVHSIRRDPTNEGKYYIYYLYSLDNVINGQNNPTYLNTISVDANNYSVSFGPSFDLKNQNLANKFGIASHFISELEVSPDGSKIAVHDESDILVYNINTNSKQVSSLLGWYLFAPYSLQSFSLSGMEFTANSNKLVFNRFNSGLPQYTQVLNNIGVLDLNNISNGQFACSWVSEDPTGKTQSIVSRGGLELGRDGHLYSVAERGLYKLNLNTMLLEPSLIFQIGNTINLSNDLYLGGSYSIRPLPEQIDGQTFLSEGYHLDDEVFPTTNAQIIFNNLSTSSGALKIRGENKIYSNPQQGVIFENVTINPSTGSTIKVMAGANLEITNTNIETDNCNKMWQGIIVENGGGLKIQNTTSQVKYIKDAIIAVNYSGAQSGLIINNYNFDRNERTLIINNGAISETVSLFMGNINVKNNVFKNTQTLKDLTKGQTAINFENANKGISSIEANQTGTPTNNLLLEENYFEGGLFGVKASNSHIKIAGCRFSNIKGIATVNFFPRINVNYGSAIFVEKNDKLMGNYSLTVGINTSSNNASLFSENSRHITVYNGVSLKVGSTSFSNSYQKGIEWVKNKGCSLEVTYSNFLNCANSSIYCDDNAFPQTNEFSDKRTYLKIEGNTFRNDKFDLNGNTTQFLFNGNAILINDLGKTANTGYNHLEVSANQIYNLRTGIVLNGVTGGKSDLKQPELKTTIYNIDNNGPVFIRSNAGILTPSGIHVVNSMSLALFQNYDLFSEMVKGIPNEGNAIYIENSPYLSIKSNSLKGKYGIRAKMNNINSEILCNTFSRNRFGIMQSDKHMLRNTSITHGIKGVESRSNKYLNSGISDLHWIEPLENVKNWWVIENNGVVKEACYQAGTTNSCFGPFTSPGSSTPFFISQTLIKDFAPDFCKGNFPAGLTSIVLSDTSPNPISQWELDFTYAVNTLKNNQGISLTDKVRIIKAIEYTQTNNFDSALALLYLPFENNLDQQYISLLKKYIGFNYPTPRMPDSLEKNQIKAIALQNPSENGSHVYLARSIMQSLYDEQFAEKDISYRDIHIELLNTACVQFDSSLQVVMLNASGIQLPIKYAFDNQFNLQILGESLNELLPNETYLVKINHKGNSYQLSKSLVNFFNSKNSISLECSAQLGKRGIAANQTNHDVATVSVFPNPVGNSLSIQGLSDTNYLCDISIIDMLGRTIMEVKQHHGNKDLDVSKLQTGFYCLILKNNNQHYQFLVHKQ